MDHGILGKILASVIIAAADVGAIMRNSSGIVEDANAIGQLVQGFLAIWLRHPASGATLAIRTQVAQQAEGQAVTLPERK